MTPIIDVTEHSRHCSDTPPSREEKARMALLSELETLRDVLRSSIEEAPAYSRAPLAREYRAVVTQIAEMSMTAEDEKPKETGLSDFERRLRERESGSKTSRRAQTG